MTEAAFTYVNQYGAVGSYASNDFSETYFQIRRYMLLRYTNWIISDADFENHITAIPPSWVTYHCSSGGNDGPKYVFVDFNTTFAQPTAVTWKSILGPARSEATLEVFAVRSGHYGETSDAYLKIIREFAIRAAELAGQSIEPYDDVQFVYSDCIGRGQWERSQAREAKESNREME